LTSKPKEQFVQLAADALSVDRFTLADIGCSGGLDPEWRIFGDRFAAVGFDASVEECRRLAEQETNPNVHYVPGFVDIPPDHPFALRAGVWAGVLGSFFYDTSCWATIQMRAEHLAATSLEEKLSHNRWQETELADPAKPIYAPKALSELGFSDVDFLKIDVDGPDFRILSSFDGLFGQLGILAVRLEVFMFGGISDTAHTFHNTDRFMRQQGFELVRLDTFPYSKRALPARYRYPTPSVTVTGRLYQGEAYYALLPSVDDKSMSADKLIKLAAIFSVWEQPDGAAEILLAFRDQLAPLLDVDAALDVLAAQTQAGDDPLPYRDYMALFAADSPRFYPPPKPPEPPWQAPARPTFFQRLQAAWYSVSDWTYIEKLMGDLKERRRT
jgi:hypothetical protein